MKNLGDIIDLKKANPKLTTITGCLIGILLIDNLSTTEQNSLGNFLELVGQVLLANASQQALIETQITGNNININSRDTKEKYNPIFYDINKLREILKLTTDSNEYDFIIKSINIMKEELENIKKRNF